MFTVNLRLGLAELALAASLALLAGLVVLFVIEWPVGLVPAVSYAIASVGAYAGYRQYARERMRVDAEERVRRFRVVETRGVCPLGRRRGDVFFVGGGNVSPSVCPEAGAVLLAASDDERDGSRRWCCPVYDHLLVFEKEPVAA